MARGYYRDLTGRRFGKLVVVERAEDGVTPSGSRYVRWLCHCDCGTEKIISASGLTSGTKSCGCWRKERMALKKKYCDYDLSGDFGIGYAHNTGTPFYFDKEDYGVIKDYCWSEHILKNGYHALEAWDCATQKVVRMPWVIMGKNYDHANRNPLDNRKENLRPATADENAANHSIQKSNWSGVIGVYWSARDGKWISSLRKGGKILFFRRFDSFDDAVVSRLLAELAFFGEFAPQKHLLERYGIKGGIA